VVGGTDFCPNHGGPANNNGCPPGQEPQHVPPADSTGPTPTLPPALPTLPADECVAATRDATRVNIRSIPSTDGAVVGQMLPYSLYPVTGQFTNGIGEQWWHITEGWIAAWVTRAGQNCERVPEFAVEPGARLGINDDGLRDALDPEDDLPPGSMLALIPFPNFEEVADLPLKTIPCQAAGDGSVFVAIVGSLQIPTDPCKFQLNNGLDMEITDQGLKLMHGNTPLGMFMVGDPHDEEAPQDVPPNPCDEMVAYGKGIDPNAPPPGGMTSFFPCPEDAPDGKPGKTFIMHDIGNMTEGGGMIIVIGGAEMTDGAPFSTLMSNEGWNKLKKGQPDDGIHALDLGGALELQSCDELGGCLELLITHTPVDDAPHPTNPLPDAGGLTDTTPPDGANSGVGGSIGNLIAGPAETADGDDNTPPNADPPDFPGAGSLANDQDMKKPPQDCSTVSIYHFATVMTPGNTCEAGSIPGAYYVQAGTLIGLFASANSDGTFIDPNPDIWQVNCYQAGMPVLLLNLGYGLSSFTVNGSGWSCGVDTFNYSDTLNGIGNSNDQQDQLNEMQENTSDQEEQQEALQELMDGEGDEDNQDSLGDLFNNMESTQTP
jgi:hypothetical protein